MDANRRSREDRRRAISNEAADSRREGGGFGGPMYLATDEELEKLGVRRYVLDSGEDDKGRSHRWSFLQPHPADPCVTALGLYIHWNIGISGDRFLCPRFMKREFEKLQSAWLDAQFPVPDVIKHGRCPICEERDRAVERYKATREGMAEKERKDWRTSHIYVLQPFHGSFTDPQPNRRIAWIVDEHDDKTLDLGVQLVEIAVGGRSNPGVYKGLMDQAVDRETGEVLDVLDDSDQGYIFSFWREGSGMDTTYASHKLVPRRGALDAEWLNAVPRFMQVLRFATYDEIKEAFVGLPEASEAASVADSKAVEAKELRKEMDDALDKDPVPQRRRAAPDAAPEAGVTAQAAEEPRRARRRGEPPPEDIAPKDGPDGGVSAEAEAIAERIRNRRSRREKEAGQ